MTPNEAYINCRKFIFDQIRRFDNAKAKEFWDELASWAEAELEAIEEDESNDE